MFLPLPFLSSQLSSMSVQRRKHHFGILEDLEHYPDGDV